uniref:Uncharacterized protein n=1 Tax=Pavo cristatus TaxID=9049 RepID=A0A8C9FMW0_PAVCR
KCEPSLYTVKAVIILDNDGDRLFAKSRGTKTGRPIAPKGRDGGPRVPPGRAVTLSPRGKQAARCGQGRMSCAPLITPGHGGVTSVTR